MAIVLHAGFNKELSCPRDAAQVNAEPAHYREFVFRCALAVCAEPDGAEDVAQEVLLILFLSQKKLERLENPDAWVRRVTVRYATRHLKRLRQHRGGDALQENLQAPETSSDSAAVHAILQRLTPEQRALLGMAFNQGLSYREIGDALGIPEGTVASRLNTAKNTFRRMWEL